MSDRELLEKAAKAAGDINLPLLWVREFDGDLTPVNNRGEAWNPLTDDGDALRLAVKLELDLTRYAEHSVVATGRKPTHGTPGSYVTVRQSLDGDPYAATRKAIVRAAAAIGEHE